MAVSTAACDMVELIDPEGRYILTEHITESRSEDSLT
jgi:hypothetical protein